MPQVIHAVVTPGNKHGVGAGTELQATGAKVEIEGTTDGFGDGAVVGPLVGIMLGL